MRQTRTNDSNQSGNLWFRLIKGILMFFGLLFILGLIFFYVFKPQNEISLDTEFQEIETPQEGGLDSVLLVLNQKTVNDYIYKLIQDMENNPFDLKMEWQDDIVLGNLELEFQGSRLPASFKAKPSIYQNQLALEFESIQIAQFPLPLNEAYQSIAESILLPEGFYFHPNQARVHIDLNQIIQLDEPNFIQVQNIDFDKSQLNLQIFFDPDQDFFNN